MNILFLCRQSDLGFGQASLARALERRGVRITCVEDGTPLNERITTLVSRCGERPSLIFHPELSFPLLPEGLAEIDIPTACFQIDTYAYTQRRIRWSMLFDHPIVFHPGYQEQFKRAGHPGATTFFHAASKDLFCKAPVERIFDVGAIGRTHTSFQRTRRRVLTALGQRFRTNEWERLHTFEEMADVYRHSRIVVNVARDDFPQDANMRAFEAMAAGCLLISRVPTELTAIGFQENVHFVAYRQEDEIMGLVEKYLSEDAERERIAWTGRDKVLTEHTYDCRAEQLLRIIEVNRDQRYAPARRWVEKQVRMARLDYFAANSRLDYACDELRLVAKRDLLSAASGGGLIARAVASKLRGHLNSYLERNG